MTTLPTSPDTIAHSPFSASLQRVRWEPILWVLAGTAILLSRLYLMLTRSILFTDESLYLAETQAMFHRGVMVPWAWNPGVAVFNMLWYAPFYNIALGLDYASRIATFYCSMATFGLMVLNLRALVENRLWLLVSILLALASVPFWNTLLNSSDNYYLVFALLIMTGSLRNALRSPPFCGHGRSRCMVTRIKLDLTRNDGTVVYRSFAIVFPLWMIIRTISLGSPIACNSAEHGYCRSKSSCFS